MFDNSKRFLADDGTFYACLVLVVACGAFGLGILAERWNEAESQPLQPAGAIFSASSQENEQVVASQQGSVYHLPWCAGAQQMKEENKVWFASPAEAEAAGYRPASNCQGL